MSSINKTNAPLFTCSRCVMDSNQDPDLTLDSDGLCNHCVRFDKLRDSRMIPDELKENMLSELINKIKKEGANRSYDCIVGVSGGVDSTYVSFLVKKLGLRPLAIHFDNGWNSELAVKNIENVLKVLNIDLFTYVVDWHEFRDLQLSFLKASTPDGEIPTDHAISALLWQEASKRGIKYIISGMNFATEAISVPAWAYGHSDWKYIRDIHSRFGVKKLKTYPRFGFFNLFYYNFIRGVRIVSILNYVDYDKDKAKNTLVNELGWRDYGGKHYESIYTRFFQGYVLPTKFGIDKRVGHLSDLINSGQITRSEALLSLTHTDYPDELSRSDKEYVIKKLGLNNEKFDEIMSAPVKSFKNYRNSYQFVQFLRNLVNSLRALGLYPR